MIMIIGKKWGARAGLIMMFCQSLKNSKKTRQEVIQSTILKMGSGLLLCHKRLIRQPNAL